MEKQKEQLETILRNANFPSYIIGELSYSDGAWVSIDFDQIEDLDSNIREAIAAGATTDQSDKGLILEIRA